MPLSRAAPVPVVTPDPVSAPAEAAARALRAHKSRVFFVTALIVAVLSPVVVWAEPRSTGALAAVLGAFAAAVTCCGLLIRYTSLPPRIFTPVIVVLLLGTMSTGVWLLGSEVGPAFAFVVMLPLFVAVNAPDHRGAVFSSVIGSALAQALLYGTMNLGPDEVSKWGLAWVTASSVALAGTRQYRRLLEAHRKVDEARIEGLEKLRESELRRDRAERLAVVGQLAAGVAHEINNPLAFATQNLRFVQEELGGRNAEADEALEETMGGLQRITQIVKDLRAFSRVDETDEATASVPRVVEESLRLASLKLQRVPKVEVLVPGDLPPVRFCDRRLVQVVVNLLVNASDALVSSGRPGRITVRAAVEGDTLALVIEDEGPGIAEEVLPRIFDPFFTTKPLGAGTGLGLSLSQEYMRRYAGSIRAENRTEGGARFVLSLALAGPPSVPAGAVAGAVAAKDPSDLRHGHGLR